jgi:hypothetical protein
LALLYGARKPNIFTEFHSFSRLGHLHNSWK